MTASSYFFLDDDPGKIEAYLKEKAILPNDIKVDQTVKPGEGNMNKVVRVILSDSRSIILKQARDWVEKYPQIEAPRERIEVEHTYYATVAQAPDIRRFSPEILHFDQQNYLMVMEDLGESNDFTFVYRQSQGFTSEDIHSAIYYMNGLKNLTVNNYPPNMALRTLNHQHIFHLPFIKDNDFDLDQIQPGLQKLSMICKQDQILKNRIAELGRIYLSQGIALVHGDFYPGSLLSTSDGLKVIDPEFSFQGPEEWDPAVFTAHLLLAGSPDQESLQIYKELQKSPNFSQSLFSGFTGVEVLRRLIGLAQVPLDLPLDHKGQLLEEAITWVKQQKIPTLSPL